MTLVYDATYEGLLSAIFESYRLRTIPLRIVPEDQHQQSLFDQVITVNTNDDEARRVIRGLEKKCGKKASRLIYRCFLSEKPGVEMLINHFIRTAMVNPNNVLENYRDEKILKLHQIDKQIGREVHRMHAFVRFQETKDGMMVSIIEPDFNVLPLIGKHFVDRYPAFEWLIYDGQRRYGIHFKDSLSYITFSETQHRYLADDVLTCAETQYQHLWRSYFRAVDIPERRNLKLHVQHVPKRYWKYLIEKNEG
jgi:probable DNA metabolism protein